MLQVKNAKVYDLEESVIACRNAMRTELPEYTEGGLGRVLQVRRGSPLREGIHHGIGRDADDGQYNIGVKIDHWPTTSWIHLHA